MEDKEWGVGRGEIMDMKFKDGDKTYVISPKQIKRLEIMFWLIILMWFATLTFVLFAYMRLDQLNAITLLMRGCG